MDIALTQAINGISGNIPALDEIMIAVTNYGVFLLVFAVFMLWWRKMDRSETRNACIVSGLAFIISLGLNQILLLFLHRVRPYDAGVSHLIIAANPDWSFPSDHATAVAAVVAAFWFKEFRRISGAFGVLALAICVSRVYTGVHYISDVGGGVLIGVVTAFAISSFYRNDSWYAQRLVNFF